MPREALRRVFLINFYEIHRSGIGFETEDDGTPYVRGNVSAADHPAKSVNFRYTPDPPCLGEAHQRAILILVEHDFHL